MVAPVRRSILFGFFLTIAAGRAFAGVQPPPDCTGPSGTIIVPVGTPYSDNIVGDAGGLDVTVFDNGTLPPGATLAPPSGSTGSSPFNVVFSFTPGPSDAGQTYTITIEFRDEQFPVSSPGFCQFDIEVPALDTTTTTSTTTSTTVTTSSTVTSTSTTTTTFSDCGNGIIDTGEECDPPNGEICNNLEDDDDDNLVDCADLDCAPLTEPSCGANCQLVEACQEIEKDPARIRFADDERGLDAFWIHGRFQLRSAMDPSAEGFGISLSNASGSIYRATLAPDQIQRANGRFVFRDAGARRGEPVGDGLYSVGIRLKKIRGVDYVTFRLRAYAVLSAATESIMTTNLVVGNDIGSLTAEWTRTRDGWRLSQRDY